MTRVIFPSSIIQFTQTYESLSDAERSRLTKRNFYRFLEKWGDREDLLLDGYDEDEDEDDIEVEDIEDDDIEDEDE